MTASPPVELRAPRPSDRPAEGVRLPDPGHDAWAHTRVAVAGDGTVVGVAWLTWDATTQTWYAEVTVEALHRRRGIGTGLYVAACRTVADQPHPVLARAMGSRPERRAFADALGCSVLFHCPEPWVDPTSPDLRAWTARQTPPPGHTVTGMDAVNEQDLARAWADYFTWAHTPFGTVRPDHLPAAWARLRDGLDPGASSVGIEADGSIGALSLVSPDVWDGRTMVVAETRRRDQPDGGRLLRATLARSFDALHRRGTRLVELEGHSTDAHHPALVADLPTTGGDPMDVLRLTRP